MPTFLYYGFRLSPLSLSLYLSLFISLTLVPLSLLSLSLSPLFHRFGWFTMYSRYWWSALSPPSGQQNQTV